MSYFTKSDMLYKDYKWTAYANDNPKISGYPDSALFNRHEGYEVLYLINKLAELWSKRTLSDCQKMERMIRQNLPSDIHSQEKVQIWIGTNWGKY